MIINNVAFYIPLFVVMCYKYAQFYQVLAQNTNEKYYLRNNDVRINSTAEGSDLKMKTILQEILDLKLFKNRTKRNTGFQNKGRKFFNDEYEKYLLKSDKFGGKVDANSTEVTMNVMVQDDKKALIEFDEKAREDAFRVTTPVENPYSVLLYGPGSQLCSGSLLTPEWVLTAAHCLHSETGEPHTELTIYAGGNSLQEMLSKKHAPDSQIQTSRTLIPHPSYDPEGDADIGLIKVDGKFNLTKAVKTVKLSTKPWTYHSYYNCNFTGFGSVQRDIESALDYVRKTHSLLVKNPCLCSFKFKMLLGSEIAKKFVCSKLVEDFGVCGGDSGSGLICDGEVKAVARMIMKFESKSTCRFESNKNLKCGSETTLSIFQDSCPFLSWINGYVKLYNASEISSKCVFNGESCNRRRNHQAVIFLLAVFTTLSHSLHS